MNNQGKNNMIITFKKDTIASVQRTSEINQYLSVIFEENILTNKTEITGVLLKKGIEYKIKKIMFFDTKFPLVYIRLRTYKVGTDRWKYLMFKLNLDNQPMKNWDIIK